MLISRKIRFFVVFFIILLSFNLSAQESGKKVLTANDYERWRSIPAAEISGDGQWVSYAYRTVNRDDTLSVKNIMTQALYEIPRGSAVKFSDDSRWAAYMVSPPVKEVKKLKKAKKPVPLKAELLDLSTGGKTVYENVKSIVFQKGAQYIAVHLNKTDTTAKHRGSGLVLRSLSSGLDEFIGSVYEFRFNKPGTMMAYTVDAADSAGNGVYLADLKTGMRRPLDTDRALYDRLTWEKEGRALAVVRGSKKKGFAERDNILLAFPRISEGDFSPRILDPAEVGNFPEGTVLSERGALLWSSDLSRVFFGVKEQEKQPEKKNDEPVANVDVFHWKDPRIQTVQMRQAERDRNFTYMCVFHVDDGRYVQLADKSMRYVTVSREGRYGIGRDDRAYMSDWKEPRADYYRVDFSTGERSLVISEQGRALGMSPDGKHFLFWKDGHICDYMPESNEKKNLTAGAPVSFENVEYDHPGTKPPYGFVGWTKDGAGIVVNARYDLWHVPFDGSGAKNLTSGEGDRGEIRFRYVRTDPDEEYIDLSKTTLLSAYGHWTKKAGFFELKSGDLHKLIYEDCYFGSVRKAKKADRYLFTMETFSDFPDYYFSGPKFESPAKVTDANPWRAEYKWGHRILFEFTNKDGVRLQGTLAVPEDYRQRQRLPMIVSFYEKKSQDMHRFYAPLYESRYLSGNIGPVMEFSAYVSNGYLIMQPDVHLNTRTTHDDMLDCVEAATRRVIEMGYADPDRIALCGGSFSGGGSAYIATKSDMFACVASRAAPINLAGEFNILFSGSGQNNHRYDIYGQGRYGTNPFDDFELYRSQSPITHVRTMNTPLLYLHGKQDGSVEYLQGMEFYNALRFLGKPVIFLSYPDEGHNLKKYENQKDFTIRLWQFFDHYLKDKPAPGWMVNGVPYLKKKK